jgi:ADP-ribose pyrophosphatase
MTSRPYEVLKSQRRFDGRVISVRSDTVRMPGGAIAVRDVVEHPGAVGVLVLDDDDRILMIRQYRHPVGGYLWELPAGILDEPGESALLAAQRELLEEVGVRAARWDVLVDVHSSAGMTDEAFRVYLARNPSEKAADFVPGEHEEADMQERWVSLDDAVSQVLAGEITNGMAVASILAADRVRRDGYASLRPPDSSWRARPQH